MTKRKARSHRVDRSERVGATPETLAKLAPDWRLEILNPDQQWACQRIKRGYELLSVGLSYRVGDLLHAKGYRSPEQPCEAMIESDYRRFWGECSGPGYSLTAVHGVLVDPLSTVTRDRANEHQRWIVPSEAGRPVPVGHVEMALDRFLQIVGRRSIDSDARESV